MASQKMCFLSLPSSDSVPTGLTTTLPAFDVATAAILPAENGFFEPFLYKNDHFAKTGSGQT